MNDMLLLNDLFIFFPTCRSYLLLSVERCPWMNPRNTLTEICRPAYVPLGLLYLSLICLSLSLSCLCLPLFFFLEQFYTQTLGFMHGPNLAPGLDKSWPAHVEFQSVAFSAAACYWEVKQEAFLSQGHFDFLLF